MSVVADFSYYQPLLSWLVLVALIVGISLQAAKSFNLLWWTWDDGNGMYPAYASLKKHVPNIDFRTGYPGMFAVVLGWLYRLCGVNLAIARGSSFVAALLTASCVYLALDQWVPLGTFWAALAFLLVMLRSYLSFPSPNAGFCMEAAVAIGFLMLSAAFASVIVNPAQGISCYSWILLGASSFLIGFSFTFKQSGVFSLLGYWTLLIMLCDASNPLSYWLRIAGYALVCILPFSLLLLLRLRAVRRDMRWRTILFAPWLLCLLLAGKVIFMPVASLSLPFSLSVEQVLCLGIVSFASSFLWILIYPGGIPQWKQALREMFVTVPALIDRHLPEHDMGREAKAIAIISAAVLLLSYSWGFVAALIGNNGEHISAAMPDAVVYGVSLLVAIAICVSPAFLKGLQDFYFLPHIIGIVGLSSILLIHPTGLGIVPLALLLFACSGTMSLYPYPGNTMYATLAMVACLVSYMIALQDAVHSLPAPLNILGYAWGGAITIGQVVASFERIKYINRTVKDNGVWHAGGGYTYLLPEKPFVWTTDWLRKNTSVDDRIVSYPNFALCHVLADRPSASFMPNFLGDGDDFQKFVDSLSGKDAPNVVVISPNLYPYGEDNGGYFFTVAPALTVLFMEYDLVDQYKNENGECCVAIYRKQA